MFGGRNAVQLKTFIFSVTFALLKYIYNPNTLDYYIIFLEIENRLHL